MIRFIARTAIAAGAAGMLAAGVATPVFAAGTVESGEPSSVLSAVVGGADDIVASVVGADVLNLDKLVAVD
ncbi:hypothetical protein [Glycomyces luteolus]|nr:hypothetical protein [Glycomyces luteolus]